MMTSRTTGSTKKLIMWYKVNELFSNDQTERNWKDLQIQSVMMFIIIILYLTRMNCWVTFGRTNIRLLQ